MRLRVVLPAEELDLEVDVSEPLEVLRNQVFSLIDLAEEELVLILQGVGVVSDDHSLAKASEGAKLYVRKRVRDLPSTWKDACSALYIDEPTLQPTYRSEGLLVCGGCVTLCRDGLANEAEIHSGPMRCECMERNEGCFFGCRKEEWYPPAVQQEARGKLEEECKALWKQYYEKQIQDLTVRIRRLRHVVLKYEEEEIKEAALRSLPEEIKALQGFDKVEKLIKWFKNDFFQWLTTPLCTFCSVSTRLTATAAPSEEELLGLASSVDIYTCPFNHQTRFPRFHHPGKLLETRKGKWEEWAICCGLLLRAVGNEVRLVTDCEERMWNEVWSGEKERWVHCDCVEGKIDTPLLYEQVQGRKIGYVFAGSVGGVRDVTKRYVEREAEERRRVPEPWVELHLAELNIQAKTGLAQEIVQLYEKREKEEGVELAQGMKEPQAAEIPQDVPAAIPQENPAIPAEAMVVETSPPIQEQPIMQEPDKEVLPTAEPTAMEVEPSPSSSMVVEVTASPSRSMEEAKSPGSSPSREAFKVSFQAAFKQVMQGCGRSGCTNQLCASCPNTPKFTANAAVATIIKLLKSHEFHFCTQ